MTRPSRRKARTLGILLDRHGTRHLDAKRMLPVVGDAFEAELLVAGDRAAIVCPDVEADAVDSRPQQLLAQPGAHRRREAARAELRQGGDVAEGGHLVDVRDDVNACDTREDRALPDAEVE